MYSLILVGGGHAHLGVLRALAMQPLSVDVALVTPSFYQTYSGMLPGWLAGHYSLADCQIDLRPLAQAAGVTLLIGQLVGMDANRRCVVLSDGQQLDYKFLSLAVGSESNLSWLGSIGSRLLAIKPIEPFVQRWPEILMQAACQPDYHLAVVGGGAAGVEIVLAIKQAFSTRGYAAGVSLIMSDKGLLPGHNQAVVKRARSVLRLRGVVLHQAHAVGVKDGLLLSTGQHLSADTVIATTGSTSPCWLQLSHLALDEQGYINVSAMHQSRSHPEVFAAGDVCARSDTVMARSGVHAVFAGPILAANLIASLNGGELSRYHPRRRSLYLLATGPKHAIASWGMFSASGHWVWCLKNWIDSRFMNKHKSHD